MSAAPQPMRSHPTTDHRSGATSSKLQGAFYAHGIHAVGVDTIAAESESQNALYNRFESKDGLVVAYLQFRHDAWWQRLESRLEHLGDGKEAANASWRSSIRISIQSADRGAASSMRPQRA